MSKIKKIFYQVDTANIDKRIILLSDIHYHNKKEMKYLNKVLVELQKMEYDYLCISGDLIDSSKIEDEELLIEWLRNLATISKVIIGIGNHELCSNRTTHAYDFNSELYDKIKKIKNVKVLDNADYTDGAIRFIGLTLPVDYYYRYHENKNYFMRYVNNVFQNPYNDKYNIVLCHSPKCVADIDTFEKIKLFDNVQLVLSGHMHAGATPYLMRKILKGRGVIGPSLDLFPKNAYGHLAIMNTDIIVSSGITTASNSNVFSALDSMFLKEITVIDLTKE